MKRILSILLIILIAPIILCAETLIGEGDSIMYGYPDGIGPMPSLATALGGLTYVNHGVGGSYASDVLGRISGELDDHDPDYVYLNIGSNGARNDGSDTPVALSTYLGQMDSILAIVVAHGAEERVNAMVPGTVGGWFGLVTEQTQTNLKLYSAGLEDWAYTNSIPMTSTQDMCRNDPDYEDDLAVAYNADGLHLTSDGNTKLGQLMAAAAVPTRTRVWGSASYPSGPTHVSWAWMLLAGGASITGDANTGTLSLPQNATAASTVEAIVSGTKTIQISATVASGAVVIKYRTAGTTNFDRDAETSWNTYSAPFSTTDQLVQVQVSNTEATTATVSDLTLDWTGDIPDTRTFTNSAFHGGGTIR